jgi:hypothetical protein
MKSEAKIITKNEQCFLFQEFFWHMSIRVFFSRPQCLWSKNRHLSPQAHASIDTLAQAWHILRILPQRPQRIDVLLPPTLLHGESTKPPLSFKQLTHHAATCMMNAGLLVDPRKSTLALVSQDGLDVN